jgi:hypothetical protein
LYLLQRPAKSGPQNQDVFLLPLIEVGPPRPVFGRSSGFTGQDWDVSSDGKRVLAAVPVGPPPEPITLVQNWIAALKK